MNDNSQHLVSLMANSEKDEASINSTISDLESTFHAKPISEDASRFNDLIGLYEVQHVLTSNKKNNPVGGKWTRSNGIAQKLFNTRKTYQHLLPYNQTGMSCNSSAVAEAINVISLDALGGLIRASVILRGDAVPLTSETLKDMNTNRTLKTLSNLTVRAYFDPPRIVLGKRKSRGGYKHLPLQIGPTSNVVLDTTYYDNKFRIGMGGTSGTRFVFARTNEDEAKEYEELLNMPLANKFKVMSRLGVVLALGLCVASGGAGISMIWDCLLAFGSFFNKYVLQKVVNSVSKNPCSWILWSGMRALAGVVSFVIGVLMVLISFSSGGIERDDMLPVE